MKKFLTIVAMAVSVCCLTSCGQKSHEFTFSLEHLYYIDSVKIETKHVLTPEEKDEVKGIILTHMKKDENICITLEKARILTGAKKVSLKRTYSDNILLLPNENRETEISIADDSFWRNLGLGILLVLLGFTFSQLLSCKEYNKLERENRKLERELKERVESAAKPKN